ncbi:hypothetical protein [Kitasatospora phosalacinea]|uniref:hypothetical protein n=1 Tax=Kitasatospora phosalacinea TaxID=2065 RepID=UPI000A3F323B|nr:hypothetical protein [Kitasatospora phosalacinea]
MAAVAGGPRTVTLDHSHDATLALAVRDALGLTDPLGGTHRPADRQVGPGAA